MCWWWGVFFLSLLWLCFEFRDCDDGFVVHAAPETARMSAIPAEESDQLLIRPL